MYEVKCYTNLDPFQRCQWPKQLVCPPSVGDTIFSTNNESRLEIVHVSHKTREEKSGYGRNGPIKQYPYVEVELHYGGIGNGWSILECQRLKIGNPPQ